jgi:hypothetical protein
LRQQINCERDYRFALEWVRTCLIIHSLVTREDDFESDEDFLQWVADGLNGHDEGLEDDDEVEGFTWVPVEQPIAGETEGQRKHQHVQEALFYEVYEQS